MSQDLLSSLPQVICDALSRKLPELKACEPHSGKFDLDELKKKSLPAPAVLVSMLGAAQDATYGDDAHSFMLRMAAYVVTKDALGLPRDIAAANIGQKLLATVPGRLWVPEGTGAARKVALHSLVTGRTRDVTASLWAVTWTQPVSFFEPEPLPLGVDLYVGQAPAIGVEHQDSYSEIGGAS